ncbi:hypothetical protein FHT40_006316 [Mycolicibacterium sp. BK556]|uniref:hypothetical protein n=1 Tax=unclassified Mycolicibacterium TaxID=2636767 RepID=UPI00161C5F56|nr:MULTISPECIES: hypothetical protein [unclassified Mycolicibacterium]MBB3606625.1 hypothetical protein [Mycolicibacterium sp. BK556]MBB3636128.1 hypothetical protein [Mycolicibacterium sp. BK607]
MATAIQDADHRKEVARRVREVRDAMRSVAVGESEKSLLCELLRSAENYIVEARIIALGIDQKVRSVDKMQYSVLCAAGGIRTVEDLDPIPTPEPDLHSMHGGQGFSMRPRNAGSIMAVDRVEGLTLWNRSEFGMLRVIYDPVAGAALDDALDSTVDMLIVTPNKDYPSEYTEGTTSEDGFFGVAVANATRQDEIFAASLAFCAEQEIEMLVLPELAATPNFDDAVRSALAPGAHRREWPAVVVGGSRHLEDGDRRVNRLCVTYRLGPHVVHHDKMAHFVNGPAEVRTEHGLDTNRLGEENITRSVDLRIHAGIEWSMIPLICADFLDEVIVKAVATLHPRLVVVAAMSPKVDGFERSADEVIAACQATVAIANGPALWSPQSAGAAPKDAKRADVAVVMLPLAAPELATLRVSPEPDVAPPYLVHYRSADRSALLLA